jgi:hypothetical protein
MATPTSLTATTDLPEYSANEVNEGRATIMVKYSAIGGSDMSGEQLTLELIKARRTRDVAVYTSTITLTGTSDPNSGILNIFLPDLVDSDQLYLARRGRYLIRITSVSDTNITIDSDEFLISIITAQQLRETYVHGISLEANDIPMVHSQPANVTGVEVMSVGPNHPLVFATLIYHYDDTNGIRHLSWGGGPIVQISAPGTFLLRFDETTSEYISVRIKDLDDLPTTNQVDELLVERSKITDAMIQRFIEQSCDWWENDKIAVFLEPTNVVSNTDTANCPDQDWDVIVPAVSFYPSVPGHWIRVDFPWPWLLRVNNLYGQIADTRIINVDLSWVEISELSGMCQLVPFNQEAAFSYLGVVWVGHLRKGIAVPNFWRFNIHAGLRKVDGVVLEILGKKAAIDILTIAGQAFRGGFSSQSISRDGISESVSYTSSAIYGIYSATIEDFNKFINREIKNVRGRYRGHNMVVV